MSDFGVVGSRIVNVMRIVGAPVPPTPLALHLRLKKPEPIIAATNVYLQKCDSSSPRTPSLEGAASHFFSTQLSQSLPRAFGPSIVANDGEHSDGAFFQRLSQLVGLEIPMRVGYQPTRLIARWGNDPILTSSELIAHICRTYAKYVFLKQSDDEHFIMSMGPETVSHRSLIENEAARFEGTQLELIGAGYVYALRGRKIIKIDGDSGGYKTQSGEISVNDNLPPNVKIANDVGLNTIQNILGALPATFAFEISKGIRGEIV